MPRSRPPYPRELRQELIQLARSGWDNAGDAFYGLEGDLEVFGLDAEPGRVRIRGGSAWTSEEDPGDPEVADSDGGGRGERA